MKRLQSIFIIGLVSILLVTVSSCSKDAVTNEDPSGSMYVVNIQGMSFQPDTLYALRGYIITWKNLDAVAHTVESDDATSFNSGNIAPGGTYTFTTTSNFMYPYHCGIHPGERGVLSVVSR